MCGRYAASKNPDELVEEFEVVLDSTGGQLEADFNVAPTKPAPVVLTRVPRGEVPDGIDPDSAVRQLRLLRWGLVPSWSKDPRGGARMINARAESALHKPAFKNALNSRRCLVPADGWFEWRTLANGKQPYFMTRADGAPMAFAGLYEFWRDPQVNDKQDPAAWLITFTVLTTAAAGAPADVHDRMPVVLDPDAWGDWLDPASNAGAAQHLLAGTGTEIDVTPVSQQVNDVRSAGPQLVLPLALSGDQPPAGADDLLW